MIQQRMVPLSKSYVLDKLSNLFQTKPKTQNDLLQLLREAQNQAIIDAETLGILEGVILFTKLRVRDIMLPKKQMVCIQVDAPIDEIIHTVTHSGHSRFPVLGDKPDEIIGTLHAKDLLLYQTTEPSTFTITDIIRHATVIPESKHLDGLLNDFRINRNHMAVVVDEYGMVSGFVTLEDVIEQIIGDIADEFDIDEEAYIKAHADKHYMLKADTPIDEFNQTLNAHFSDDVYDTVGGIIMAKLGHLPERGEQVTIDGFQFTIVNADARHIKLLECIDLRTEKTEP